MSAIETNPKPPKDGEEERLLEFEEEPVEYKRQKIKVK